MHAADSLGTEVRPHVKLGGLGMKPFSEYVMTVILSAR